MTFDIHLWLEAFLHNLKALFNKRIRFVGLQGSYARNEATEASDVDIVVILDDVSPVDLSAYHDMVACLSYPEKACGFIADQKSLLNWDRSDLFQFYHDTTPLYGDLDFLKPLIKRADVQRAIQIGVCNLYHLCGHNMVHQKKAAALQSQYKSAIFILQAIYYNRTSTYIRHKAELCTQVDAADLFILKTDLAFKENPNLAETSFDYYAGLLFNWAKDTLVIYSNDI
ncbi:nucleotidyltransferase domain-containing protein [Fusibacter paucivorans]|uniref:Nucleotidyltransferase domain-containing protein n=1 Tax=Fusibacter paucivorans TaxID=76009 RepID=A0ABS5PM37_9FIRM|nr:nucleotidyltransferase domain-containing protein [Fusibacter paucivorans]MBS7526213.1 nucleotidyltransferase domain-containing protein [Fusibacter paucivorans]